MPSCLSLSERDVWLPLEGSKGQEWLRILGAHPPTLQGLGAVTLFFQMFWLDLVVVPPSAHPTAGFLGRFGQEQFVVTFLEHCPSQAEWLEQWAGDRWGVFVP